MRYRTLLVAVLTSAALLLSGCQPRTESSAEPERVQVTRGSISETVNATGFVEPKESLPVIFQAQGRVAEVLVSEGEMVEADQVLARLDTTDLELTVRQAEASVNAAQAQLDALTAPASASDLAAAEAALASAQASRDALPDAATDVQLTGADAQVAQAQAQLDRLNAGPTDAQRAASEAQLEQARIGLEQAQRALDRAELRAPIAGVVASLALKVGAVPPATQPALLLVDASSFEIQIAVDEVDVVQVSVGDPVTIQVEALPNQEIKGTIDRIAPIAGGSQGIVTFPVVVRLDASDAPGLKPGMSATVDIVTETHDSVLLVPSAAVQVDRETGQLYVEREVDGTAQRADVTVGLRDDQNSEILTGVEEGQTLLIQPIVDQPGGPFGGGN